MAGFVYNYTGFFVTIPPAPFLKEGSEGGSFVDFLREGLRKKSTCGVNLRGGYWSEGCV